MIFLLVQHREARGGKDLSEPLCYKPEAKQLCWEILHLEGDSPSEPLQSEIKALQKVC